LCDDAYYVGIGLHQEEIPVPSMNAAYLKTDGGNQIMSGRTVRRRDAPAGLRRNNAVDE